MEEWRISSTTLHFSNRWRSVISRTSFYIYALGRAPGAGGWVGPTTGPNIWKREKPLPLLKIESLFPFVFQTITHSLYQSSFPIPKYAVCIFSKTKLISIKFGYWRPRCRGYFNVIRPSKILSSYNWRVISFVWFKIFLMVSDYIYVLFMDFGLYLHRFSSEANERFLIVKYSFAILKP
jgi:hypothetical protein